jgi:hypothetical protein
MGGRGLEERQRLELEDASKVFLFITFGDGDDKWSNY